MGHRYGGMVGEQLAGNESKYVLVDAHVLTSPVLSDVNGDGHMEVSGGGRFVLWFNLVCVIFVIHLVDV